LQIGYGQWSLIILQAKFHYKIAIKKLYLKKSLFHIKLSLIKIVFVVGHFCGELLIEIYYSASGFWLWKTGFVDWQIERGNAEVASLCLFCLRRDKRIYIKIEMGHRDSLNLLKATF